MWPKRLTRIAGEGLLDDDGIDDVVLLVNVRVLGDELVGGDVVFNGPVWPFDREQCPGPGDLCRDCLSHDLLQRSPAPGRCPIAKLPLSSVFFDYTPT